MSKVPWGDPAPRSAGGQLEELARARGRPVAAALLLVAAVAAAFTWVEVDSEHSFYIAPIVLGSFCGLLGLGGLIDPRLIWSIGPNRAQLPLRVRAAGATIGVTSMVLAGVLIWRLRVGVP